MSTPLPSYVVDYDTGFPAPFDYGPGKFLTPEHIRSNQLKYLGGKVEPRKAAKPKEEPLKPSPPRRTRSKRRPVEPAPRFTKTCKLHSCQREFTATKKETLCSPECREQWTKEYRKTWQKRARARKRLTALAARPTQQIALFAD